ncbi:uncharacterized [Tachysurus ichikawai]
MALPGTLQCPILLTAGPVSLCLLLCPLLRISALHRREKNQATGSSARLPPGSAPLPKEHGAGVKSQGDISAASHLLVPTFQLEEIDRFIKYQYQRIPISTSGFPSSPNAPQKGSSSVSSSFK